MSTFARALSFVCLAALLASACSDQGEGERCDRNNGNADCEPGLVCVPSQPVCGSPATGAAQCCPSDPLAARVEACLRVTQQECTDGGVDAAGTGGATGTGGSAGTGGSTSDASSDVSTGG